MRKIIFIIFFYLSIGFSLNMANQPVLNIQNWQQAFKHDFRMNKTSGSKVSFNDKNLKIEVQGTTTDSVVLIHQKSILLDRDFAIDLQLKLNQIGRDDDGTGSRSRIVIQFITGGPLQLGFVIQINRDRYKVDDQYKIFRTDEDWHHWHFEIRTDKKMIYLIRDNAYECAHRITSMIEKDCPLGLPDDTSKSGFNITVYGTSETKTEIELGGIQITELAPISESSRKSTSVLEHKIQPGEWPMFRRDRYHTGHSPLRGNLKNPQIQWAYSFGGSMGGAYVDDVDGDGHPEMLIIINGRLTAYRLDGTTLWHTPLENVYIYGMVDLDGDGQRELVLGAGFIHNVHVLDGKTGKIRYKCPYDYKYNVDGVKIAQVNPNLRGQQIIVCTRNEISYCLSFEDGIENGRVAWTYDYKMKYFTPEFVLVDMDLDGILELVAATYGRFLVYSGLDGSVKMELEVNTGRNYGMLVVQDIDQDGYPDIIMFADQLREHIALVKNEKGKSLRLLWDKFFEQNYPVDQKELRVFDDAVDDFDDDGQIEILYGLWDETTRSNWRTILVDAVSGEIKYEIPDAYPINAVRFFDHQPPQLLLSRPKNRKELNTSHLQIVSLAMKHPEIVAELSNRTLITNPSYREYPPHIMKKWYTSQSSLKSKRFANGAFFKILDEQGKIIGIEFIQEGRENRFKTVWFTDQPFKTFSDASFLAFYPDEINGNPGFLFSKTDNHYYLVSNDGALIGKYPCGGMICQHIAGRLQENEALRILTANPFGKLICLKPNSDRNPPALEWEQPIMENQLSWGSIQGQGIPMIVDLDLDGQNEVLLSQGPDRLVLLDQNGKIKKFFSFPKAPKYFTFGQFTGRDQWDLFISYSTGSVSTKSLVLSLDGEGTAIWELMCGNGPPTVFNLRENGREDIILRDLFERRSLDGSTGRDIFPITQWCGYHLPIIVNSEGGEPFIVWTGGVYSVVVEKLDGEQMWWRPFFAYRHPCGVADVDGDDRLEIGGVTMGQIYNWPNIYPVEGPHMQFVCMDALTGETKWEFPVNSSISGTITADVDGDGNPEFIFGTTDGHLMALGGNEDESQRVVFDVSLPAAVGTPIITDLFGTGDMQILVGCGDGRLYCIQ